MIGLLVHPKGGGQSIGVVNEMTLHEVLEWCDVLSDVSDAMREANGDG